MFQKKIKGFLAVWCNWGVRGASHSKRIHFEILVYKRISTTQTTDSFIFQNLISGFDSIAVLKAQKHSTRSLFKLIFVQIQKIGIKHRLFLDGICACLSITIDTTLSGNECVVQIRLVPIGFAMMFHWWQGHYSIQWYFRPEAITMDQRSANLAKGLTPPYGITRYLSWHATYLTAHTRRWYCISQFGHARWAI